MYDDNLRQIEALQLSQRTIMSNITDLVGEQRARTPRPLRHNNRPHGVTNNNNTSTNTQSAFPSSRIPMNSVRRHNATINHVEHNNIHDLNNEIVYDTTLHFFDNVPVRPSEIQVSAATTIRRFDTVISPRNSSCPITLCPFSPSTEVMEIDHCGHLFSPDNLNTWFQSNIRCPVCRHDIRTINTDNVASTRQQTARGTLGSIAGNIAGSIIDSLLRGTNVEFANILDMSNNNLNEENHIDTIFGRI